jgi:hypothetical protein
VVLRKQMLTPCRLFLCNPVTDPKTFTTEKPVPTLPAASRAKGPGALSAPQFSNLRMVYIWFFLLEEGVKRSMVPEAPFSPAGRKGLGKEGAAGRAYMPFSDLPRLLTCA